VRMAAAIYASSKRKIAEMQEARFDESQPWDPDRPMDLPALADWAERLTNAPRPAAAAWEGGRHCAGALAGAGALGGLRRREQALPGAMSALEQEGWAALESAIRTRVAASPA